MTTKSHRTSFFALTGNAHPDDAPPVARIEVPLFQRDYAQGRRNDAVERIRGDFLDALVAAVAGDEAASVGLDFVYGGVESGTLRPLDGQQRLTTLFLLHWYLGSRSGNLTDSDGWTRFSYATRQSARMFCENLRQHPLPEGVVPSTWITDQPWYLFVWRHDPTVQSMLVMLDAIDERCRNLDVAHAWTRLIDPDHPAIWFLFLSLSDLTGTDGDQAKAEDLYIKMNSRGKPLTDFENFKARFEQTIKWSSRSAEFELKVDTIWSDLLWRVRGDGDRIDDQFLRYIEFVTEICEWRDDRTDGAGKRLGERTKAVFGERNPQRDDHLDFLFRAFDIWADRSIDDTFDGFFSRTSKQDPNKVRLFFRAGGGSEEPLNLFEACCRTYGQTRGRNRVFSLGQGLVLHAVLLHLSEGTDDFARRVRVVRNLVEASADELRLERMPEILTDVEHVIRTGAIEQVATLNQAQVDDEQAKASFLVAHPDLAPELLTLEDHELLRGSLGSFELDPTTFAARSATFQKFMSQPELWSDLLAAFLAVGEYQRQRTRSRPFLFGTNSKRHDNAWRELLTGPPRDGLQLTRNVLDTFLDRVAASGHVPLVDALRAITEGYLTGCEAGARFDWRYYMVKYPGMRENGSSTYYAERVADDQPLTMGYSLCMLKAGGRAVSGYYRDPYLLAIHRDLGDTDDVEDGWFTGYESEPRRLQLRRSGASIRCVPAGFELDPPHVADFVEEFERVRSEIGSNLSNVVAVQQVENDGQQVDTEDRIQVGADIVRRFLAAGL